MYRRVKHEFVNGELQTTDLGAWIILHDVEPDYQEGYTVGPDPEYAIAADDLNKSVRYGWMPLPKPPLTGGAETHSAVALCEDCPAVGYPTDKTRCTPCPRRYLSGEG
jgi:hypothetical protein